MTCEIELIKMLMKFSTSEDGQVVLRQKLLYQKNSLYRERNFIWRLSSS